jgi:hypothetical protein
MPKAFAAPSMPMILAKRKANRAAVPHFTIPNAVATTSVIGEPPVIVPVTPPAEKL